MDFSPDSRHVQPGRRRGIPQLSLSDLVSTGSPWVKTLSFSPAGPTDVLSPETNLSMNRNTLAVLGSQCETPKRESVSEKIPSSAPDASSYAVSCQGVGHDSPGPVNPDDVELGFERALQETTEARAVSPPSLHSSNNMAIRRINSLLVDFEGGIPIGHLHLYKETSDDVQEVPRVCWALTILGDPQGPWRSARSSVGDLIRVSCCFV
ncbi:uncharacterized protein LOC114786990 isoform X1 [Denticeps clupeoides]|uniref:uncharacterized protein LOC114786990 isoform X1 n=1 Tax=Denticeps clupeoides TaxID=299321 RepID=UPI0010A59E7E|nr:uncharacterized protein LOC114786990 isoform X1 [Denticeps clupeoides]XP_028830491.1 uncharacterized protein LOC114786990 isoform X1 [Denticeps clupeoides]XP_028830492.1 uncharacterized protein LOC114786990 isoform X1 [Denticeps clupeoides]XP_028830494.1 uncharacterized protein LOC114786990 isoform X1 [Denticeps clupeoides]